MNIPGRVFLDTNIVNFTLDWAEAIFDGGDIPETLCDNDLQDVLALRDLFMTGQRAAWHLAISPQTFSEILATRKYSRRVALENWFGELWLYWREFVNEDGLSDEHASSLARRIVPSDFLAAFPQAADRQLVAHAIAYGCDAFCTRDRRTILKRRHRMQGVPLRFLSPTEWWELVRPYAALWI